MYYVSKYIIAQPLNDREVLLYSTLSTSIIAMEKEDYKHIFLEHQFSNYHKWCSELKEMGFLYEGEENSQLKRLQNIREEIVSADHGITAITIAPTMNCNARCYYCFEKGANQGTMDYKTADAVAEFLINKCKEKTLYVSWFGGEPLMAADIISYITELLLKAEIDIESTVTTNGILINEKIIESLKFWNASRIQITVDGIGEDYNRIKNYDGNFDFDPFKRIMDNIELLIRNNMNIHLRVNYKSTDYETAKATLNYLHSRFGAYEKLYLYGAPLDLPEIKGYSEFNEDEGDYFFKVLKLSLDRGYENDELNFNMQKSSPNYNTLLGELMLSPFPASCFMVNKDRFVIDDKGNLYKCQKHLGQHEYNCGNVFEGVKKNEIYEKYVTSNLYDEHCGDCEMFPICQGGCIANRILYGNKFACPPSKSVAKKLVKAYYDYLIS